MTTPKKVEAVSKLKDVFNSSNAVFVVHYQGLTVDEVSEFRSKLAASNATMKVAKNRLALIALQGTAYESLSEHFKGPTAIIYTNDDYVQAAKETVDFSKKNEHLNLIAATVDSQEMSMEEVKQLASLPSLHELRAKLVGVLKAPAQQMVGVLNAAPQQFVRVLQARVDKEGE